MYTLNLAHQIGKINNQIKIESGKHQTPSIRVCAETWTKYVAIHDIWVLNTAIYCKYDEKCEKKSDKSSEVQRSNEGRRVIKSGEDSLVTIVTKCVDNFFFSPA